jgi:hypothetical protein
MSADYIRLNEAPRWVVQYPQCSACAVDLETDGDGWTCPVCGTAWAMNAGDGDVGELYPNWSGEVATGPLVHEQEAFLWGSYHERMERHKLFPNTYPEPRRPVISVRGF